MLKAAGWPDAVGTVMLVGHQPTLGWVAALVITDQSADWTIRKGAVWWLRSDDNAVITLQLAIGTEMV